MKPTVRGGAETERLHLILRIPLTLESTFGFQVTGANNIFFPSKNPHINQSTSPIGSKPSSGFLPCFPRALFTMAPEVPGSAPAHPHLWPSFPPSLLSCLPRQAGPPVPPSGALSSLLDQGLRAHDGLCPQRSWLRGSQIKCRFPTRIFPLSKIPPGHLVAIHPAYFLHRTNSSVKLSTNSFPWLSPVPLWALGEVLSALGCERHRAVLLRTGLPAGLILTTHSWGRSPDKASAMRSEARCLSGEAPSSSSTIAGWGPRLIQAVGPV